MSRVSKEEYYLDIALSVSKRSTCLKRHYGCIIVKNDQIIATGYNGSARGEINCCDKGECPRINKPSNSGDYSDCPAVHAEQNAMLSCSRIDMIGSVMYLDGEEITKLSVSPLTNNIWKKIENVVPCPICERMIANSGIEMVITRKGIVWERGNPERWLRNGNNK